MTNWRPQGKKHLCPSELLCKTGITEHYWLPLFLIFNTIQLTDCKHSLGNGISIRGIVWVHCIYISGIALKTNPKLNYRYKNYSVIENYVLTLFNMWHFISFIINYGLFLTFEQHVKYHVYVNAGWANDIQNIHFLMIKSIFFLFSFPATLFIDWIPLKTKPQIKTQTSKAK